MEMEKTVKTGGKRKTLRFFGDHGCAVCGADLGKVPHVNLSVVYDEGMREMMTPCPRTGLVPDQLSLCSTCHSAAANVSV
jgi:hypothetical protein